MLQFIQRIIGEFVFFIADTFGTFWANVELLRVSPLRVALDIILVAVLFYWFLTFVRGSRAVNILLGLVILAVIFTVSRAFDLFAIGWLLDHFFTVVLVAIPIIFQQELRRGLEKLGRTKWFYAESRREAERLISDVVSACAYMAKRSVGALIVFENKVSLKEYIDTGIALNAEISRELLLSIFQKESPLHDGAVIISGERIVAAACVLPHSFKKYSHAFGTRHKAAAGLAESTDARVVVVSEEKGKIAFMVDGEIEIDVSLERLEERLRHFLAPKEQKKPRK